MRVLICYSCGGVGDAMGWEASRFLLNPFLLYIGPYMNILLLHLIVTSCDLITYVNPSPKILKIYSSDIFVRLVKMGPSHTSSVKAGKLSKHGLLDCMVWTFGRPT